MTGSQVRILFAAPIIKSDQMVKANKRRASLGRFAVSAPCPYISPSPKKNPPGVSRRALIVQPNQISGELITQHFARLPADKFNQHRPARGKAMIEAVTAISVFFSISGLLPKIISSPQNSGDRLESF
jgi:hypothetical protein